MPLPDEPRSPWPPTEWAQAHREIAVATTWYEGNPDALAKLYAAGQVDVRPSERRVGGVLNRIRGTFWSRETPEAQTDRLHAPAASDVASVAADMLFGEEPTLTIPEAHGDVALGEDGKPLPPSGEVAAAKATEDHLAHLVEDDGIAATLIESAEYASGMGGVYLRPMWDESICDHAMLTPIYPDQAVPEFRHGRMVAVTFWSIVQQTPGSTWRHLERYELGRIQHALYVGTVTELGKRVSLEAHAATAGLIGPNGLTPSGDVRLPGALADQLLVRFVPNAANRSRQPWGRSETAGLESEMAALDEAWSSWMRDIRLGKARITVPDQFLDRSPTRGAGASFDLDREVFSPLNVEPQAMGNAGISLLQPDIRFEAHRVTTEQLALTIFRSAGYDPQSFGMAGDGGVATATEVRAKDARSNRTTGRKQRRWSQALGDVGYLLLLIEAEVFRRDVEPMRPTVTFVDPTEVDIRERASTLNLVNLAQAASIKERVRILHPEWDEPQIIAEADAIKLELNIGEVPDPTGGFPPR